MIIYAIFLFVLSKITPGVRASKVVIHPLTTAHPKLIAHPLALKEIEHDISDRHLPWDQFLSEDNGQTSNIYQEGKFRSSGFGQGAFVVGPPKRLVVGNNDTYRNTPITPLKENFMNCSFHKKNPAAYDEALYPFENIDQQATKTVLVVCDNSVHGTNMCQFLKVLYSAESAHCTCPHVMDGYANVGFCTLRYRDGKEMSYCNTPAHSPIWLLRLCAYKIPVSTG